jgi:hypothetical protein
MLVQLILDGHTGMQVHVLYGSVKLWNLYRELSECAMKESRRRLLVLSSVVDENAFNGIWYVDMCN